MLNKPFNSLNFVLKINIPNPFKKYSFKTYNNIKI